MKPHTYARSRRLITRRSQLQILPSLLERPRKRGLFVDHRALTSWRPGTRWLGEHGALFNGKPFNVLALARAPPDRRGPSAAIEHQFSQRILERRWSKRPPRGRRRIHGGQLRQEEEDLLGDARAGRPDDVALPRRERIATR